MNEHDPVPSPPPVDGSAGSADPAGTASARPLVRPARLEDLPAVAVLAAEHAAYEKAAPPARGLAERLGAVLFPPGGAAPRAYCVVAELPGGELVGYATCSPEFSTWDASEYLHMDCLFLRDGHRGLRLGPMLVEAVVDRARALGMAHVQWQTPVWNDGAIRFYDRLGATAKEKLRYTLPVGDQA
ncbi:GNAT family N-acetyltransferase [Yinghuangia seranimata]|uniref:GNAT family N-acetyltransferase n=1 Tax=Yinghuangia seranimata TaxID=408067 RepID=UPI00248CD25A|nr:GNAT family N-acetyltransferase [Yinghuangia seranimata]MDI2127767.1 GNAT family N-acetyltransferase [Yinghuangia seranimata]